MADVAAALVRRAAGAHGPMPVVLTGGCFQNARLAEGVRRRLQGDFDVRLHGEVPPGDGGIALGQALVADAVEIPERGGGHRARHAGVALRSWDAPDGVEWEGREG